MNTPIELLSPKAVAARLGIEVRELRAYRRRGLFVDPAARIGHRFGWAPDQVERYRAESLELVQAHVHSSGQVWAGVVRPAWWEAETVRYIGLPELAEAALLSTAAVWSHYYHGKLPAPDVTIGYRNRIAGWSPAHAGRLAADQGWRLDLARLSDTSGLAGAL